MAISKITLNGVTQMDVTQKTVTANTMLNGVTSLKNDGTDITGNIPSKTSSDLTVSGATVTAPAGNYASSASASVASGTAGTPTATKGTVSNHAISVTPSVTNTTGYITGGTKTGTAVSVSASELVSGTKSITSSGTTDVTNYASASVAAGSATTPATTVTANPSISVSSGGLITATASATKSVTPTVSAGFVSSGTAGTITVSGSNTSQLSTQAAQTIYPSTTDQTITSGKYLTGAQTIKAVKITVLEDALVYSSPISRTNLGVTFDFNADKSCYAHGKSTSTATGQYYINQSAMPSYIQKGVEYTVEYSSPNIFFQIWDYSGGTLTKLLETKTNTTFTFPTTMTGVLIRLAVANGVTVDETVHPRLYLPRTTGLSGADILEGIILEIGDADDSDRILSVTGTATRA